MRIAASLGRLLFIVVLQLFIFAPLLAIIPVSFTTSTLLSFPPEGFSLINYANVFRSPEWIGTITFTFILVAGSGCISSIIGVTTAYWLEVLPVRVQRFVALTLYAPLIVPAPVMALSLYVALSAYAHLPPYLSLPISYTIGGMPYTFTSARSGFIRYPLILDEAAQTLGARPWQSLIFVRVRAVKLYVLTGFIFATVAGLDDVLYASFLADDKTHTIGLRLWEGARTNLSPDVAVISVLLVVIGLCMAIGAIKQTNGLEHS